jgi:hypothetical protein
LECIDVGNENENEKTNMNTNKHDLPGNANLQDLSVNNTVNNSNDCQNNKGAKHQLVVSSLMARQLLHAVFLYASAAEKISADIMRCQYRSPAIKFASGASFDQNIPFSALAPVDRDVFVTNKHAMILKSVQQLRYEFDLIQSSQSRVQKAVESLLLELQTHQRHRDEISSRVFNDCHHLAETAQQIMQSFIYIRQNFQAQ